MFVERMVKSTNSLVEAEIPYPWIPLPIQGSSTHIVTHSTLRLSQCFTVGPLNRYPLSLSREFSTEGSLLLLLLLLLRFRTELEA